MAGQLQHDIPRFLLRRFGQGANVLHVLDKQAGKRFRVSTSKGSRVEVAAERGMYDFVFMDVPMTLEPALSAIEHRASTVIERIVRDEMLNLSDVYERRTLTDFLAVQLVRTRATWVTSRDLLTKIEAQLREDGAPDEFFRPDPKVGGGENAEKALRAKMINNAPRIFGPAIASKDWLLLTADAGAKFLIGDNPLTMFNQEEHGPRGTLGIKVRGIQMYFPLSPTLALAIWCPSIQQQLLQGFERLDQLACWAPKLAWTYREPWEHGLRIAEAIRSGRPFTGTADNVTHFNSLQISTAERFVFSSDGDFTLAHDMIGSDQHLRFGVRFQ